MYRQIQVINKFKTGREKNLQSFFGRNLIKNIKICDIYKFNNIPSKKNENNLQYDSLNLNCVRFIFSSIIESHLKH